MIFKFKLLCLCAQLSKFRRLHYWETRLPYFWINNSENFTSMFVSIPLNCSKISFLHSKLGQMSVDTIKLDFSTNSPVESKYFSERCFDKPIVMELLFSNDNSCGMHGCSGKILLIWEHASWRNPETNSFWEA